MPDTPLGAMWRMGDMLREYRGDSHITAWVSAGLDATEIGLLTELYWGLPMRTYSRTRAWTDDQFDAAHERLKSRGLLDDDGLHRRRRAVARGRSRSRTDVQMRPRIDALGDDIDELFDADRSRGAPPSATGFGYLVVGPARPGVSGHALVTSARHAA